MKVTIILHDGREYTMEIEKFADLDTWGYFTKSVKEIKCNN